MIFYISLLRFIQEVPISGDLLDKALEINPYNAVAYGALVAVLGFFGWLQYRERQKDKQKFLEISDKMISLLALVQQELPSLKELKNAIPEIKDLLRDARKNS